MRSRPRPCTAPVGRSHIREHRRHPAFRSVCLVSTSSLPLLITCPEGQHLLVHGNLGVVAGASCQFFLERGRKGGSDARRTGGKSKQAGPTVAVMERFLIPSLPSWISSPFAARRSTCAALMRSARKSWRVHARRRRAAAVGTPSSCRRQPPAVRPLSPIARPGARRYVFSATSGPRCSRHAAHQRAVKPAGVCRGLNPRPNRCPRLSC